MPAQRLRQWPWLAAGVIPLVSALMRVAWLYPLVHFLLRSDVVSPQDGRFPGWLMLALLMAASATARALRRVRTPHRGRRAELAGVLVGLLAVAGTVAYAFRLDVIGIPSWWSGLFVGSVPFSEGVPAVLVVVLAAAAIWWRGLTAAWYDYSELFLGFVVGTTVLGVLMLVAEPAGWARRGLNVWETSAVFVLSALLALALLAAYEMLSWERFRGRGPRLSRYWVTALGTVMAALLALGWGVGQLLGSDLGGEIARSLRPVGAVGRRGVELLLLASGYLAFEVFGGAMGVLRRILERLLGGVLTFLRLWFGESAEAAGEAAARTGIGDRGVQIVVWVLLLSAIAIVFYVAIRRFRPAYIEGATDRREFIWSRALLVAQIRGFIHGLRRPRAAAPLMQLSEVEDARRAVRWLYRQMLERLHRAGHARPPSLTPRAYEERIALLLRAERQALHTLTDAYLVARYSPDAPTPEQVLDAERALRRIEAGLGGA